jgi:vanillate monooxygenase ferredoxin subunit
MSGPALIAARVAARRAEALDIVGLDLVAVDGHALPAFTAGAHIDLHLPGGLIRQYSLCNPPGNAGMYRIAVLRDPASRGGSQAVHDALTMGAALSISAPRNHFELAPDAPHHLLLAGGIGITPLLAMAEQLSQQGASFALHHCTRSRERTPFVETLAASAYASRVHHHFDDGEAAQKLDIAATLRQAPAGTHLYVCGPQGFMDAVLNAGRNTGWPEERLHREYFAAAPVDHTNGPSRRTALPFRMPGLTSLKPATSKSFIQRSGVISG